MKKLLFAGVVAMMTVLALPLASFAADFNAAIARYAKAAQKKDLREIYDLCALTQLNEKEIRESSPKFRVEKEINQLFEQAKGGLENTFSMFTPTSKWKILETKKIKLPLFKNKPANAHVVYVGMKYPNINDAPIYDEGAKMWLRRPMKRGVFIFTIDDSSGKYYKIDHYTEEDEFWATPVRVSDLKYTCTYRGLSLEYTADGGRKGTTGGTPPYRNKVLIAGKSVNEFIGTEDELGMSELSDGQSIEIRGFRWPEGTQFPLKIRVEVTDSSTPAKTASAEVSVPNGKHVEGEWSP